jgi:pimeloyl-ACP methyl ester carboxylesterase
MRRIRGLKLLVHDAVDATTDLIQEGIDSTARTVRKVTAQVEPIPGSAETIDALVRHPATAVLRTIKLVNRGVAVLSDAGLALVERVASPPEAPTEPGGVELEPAIKLRSDTLKSSGWALDAGLGLLNGVVGDHLQKSNNGLDLGMSFRSHDHYVPLERAALLTALPAATPKLALFVHGLGTTEWSWCLAAEAYHGNPAINFGSLLERDLGYTPLWLRYNTGRHVSENGRLLSAELERLVAAYPAELEELVIVGHSMGGLVARSACHYGRQQNQRWIGLLRHVFCLGSPHRGAPLEKLGNVVSRVLGSIDLPATRIPARILSGRSDGIKDLRYGALVDEDWFGRDPDALRDEGCHEVPLLPNVSYHFVSATVTSDPEHPLGHLVGDLLVRLPSSSGPVIRTGVFDIETRRFGGIMHHQLQNHPAVYAVLRQACGGSPE